MPTFLRTNAKTGAHAPSNISGVNSSATLAEGLVAAWPLSPQTMDSEIVSGFQSTRSGSSFEYLRHLKDPSLGYGLKVGEDTELVITDSKIVSLPETEFTISAWVWRESKTIELTSWAGWNSSGGDDIFLYAFENDNRSVYWRDVHDFRGGGFNTLTDFSIEKASLMTFGAKVTGTTVDTVLALDGGLTYYSEEQFTGITPGPFGNLTIGANQSGYLVNTGASQDWGHSNQDNRISHLKIWNRMLSQAEIYADYSPNSRWDVYDTYERTYFLPATPSTSTIFLKTNAKTGAQAPSNISGVNSPSPLAEGLVAAWPLSPQTMDSEIVAGRKLIRSSGTFEYLPHAVDPSLGHGLQVGAQDYLYSTDADLRSLPTTEFTVSGWVWRQSFGVTTAFFTWYGTDDLLLYPFENNDRSVFWRDVNDFQVSLNGIFFSNQNFDTNKASLMTFGAKITGTTVDTVLAIDGGTSFYREDQFTGKTPGPFNGFSIGAWADNPTQYFGGSISNRISHVKVWNRMLSQAEIYADYAPSTRWDIYDTYQRTYYIPEVVGGSIEHLGQGHFSSSHFAPKHLSSSSAPVIPYKITMLI